MLSQLLSSLRQYAGTREKEMKKGLYSGDFAAVLICSYSQSMAKALSIIGKDHMIIPIQSESDKLCHSIYPEYQPQPRLIHKSRKTKRTDKAIVVRATKFKRTA